MGLGASSTASRLDRGCELYPQEGCKEITLSLPWGSWIHQDKIFTWGSGENDQCEVNAPCSCSCFRGTLLRGAPIQRGRVKRHQAGGSREAEESIDAAEWSSCFLAHEGGSCSRVLTRAPQRATNPRHSPGGVPPSSALFWPCSALFWPCRVVCACVCIKACYIGYRFRWMQQQWIPVKAALRRNSGAVRSVNAAVLLHVAQQGQVNA